MKKLVLVAILSMMANQSQALTVNEFKQADKTNQESYLMGYMDGAVVMGGRCVLGQKATYAQNIAIIDKYIANNPEEWGNEVGLVFFDAIIKAYHCSATPDVTPTSKTEARW